MLTKLTFVLLALAAGVVFVLSRNSATLSGEQARDLVGKGALLVDVRSPDEFAAGHIDGAINVPVQQLALRLDELGDRNRTMVLYCRSGQRSGRAMQVLREAGFTSVHNLGGMSRWSD